MKVAVIGSRGLSVSDLGRYLPENTTEIVSGGAKGVDTSAREYALSHGIKLTEFLQERSAETEYHDNRVFGYRACILGRKIQRNKIRH